MGLLPMPTADKALGGIFKAVNKLDVAASVQNAESEYQRNASLIAKDASVAAEYEAEKATVIASNLRKLVGV